MTTPALLAMRCLVALGLLAVLPNVLWELFLQRGWVVAGDPAGRLEGSMLVFLLACLAVGAFACWQRPAWPWRPACPARVVGCYAPFLLAWVLLLVGYLALARALGSPVMPQPALEYLAVGEPARPGFWLVVAGTTLGAPLAEEIVFRGYLQGALQGFLRPWPAIAVTAVIFGSVHTLPYALPVACLGLFFGWLAQRCGSLWPAVLGHALHNGVTVAVTWFWPASLDWLYPR